MPVLTCLSLYHTSTNCESDSSYPMRWWRCRDFLWCRNPMLRFGVLPGVDVVCEEWLSLHAAEKLYDGATAETANVVRALAIHNSTHAKRGVHADGQNRMQCESRSCADTRNPLTRMTSWYKPDLTYGIQ